MSTDHRANAERALMRAAGANIGADVLSFTSEATAYALLAVEARLGEIGAEMRKANTIAAFEARVITGNSEYIQARDTVRTELGLTTNPEGQPE